MADEQQGRGRPPISDSDKKLILQKIEPYLKTGLSVRKALREAKIANSTFYHLMDEDEDFREQIELFRQFTSVLLNNALVGELQAIIKKQSGYTDEKGKVHPPEKLKKEDREFLWKFALTSNSTKGEYGERKDVNLFDPEAEIQKVKGILESKTSKKLPPLPNGE